MRTTFDVNFASYSELLFVLLDELLVYSFVVATHGASFVVLRDGQLSFVDVSTAAFRLFEQLLF